MTPHGQAVGVCVRDELARSGSVPSGKISRPDETVASTAPTARGPAEATMSGRLRIPLFTGLGAAPVSARYSSGSVPNRSG
jgi:hypothetical protein